MKDLVIKGTGNSRFLKSVENFKTLYPTYDDFAAALIAGTLPIDLTGLNAEGITQAGTPLNMSTLLKTTTAERYGMDENAVPDDLFLALASKQSIANLVIDKIQTSTSWTVPKAVDQLFKVFAVGGGGGGGGVYTPANFSLDYSIGGGGGGSGNIAIGEFELTKGETINIVCGAGGASGAQNASTSYAAGKNGGTTTFGDLLSASGGTAGGYANVVSSPWSGGKGGNGGAGGGGGACYGETTWRGGNGGAGSFGGGGGGSISSVAGYGLGGNGGPYGGGGGTGAGAGSSSSTTVGKGGTYGGDGGAYSVNAKDGTPAVGVEALDILLDMRSVANTARAGKNLAYPSAANTNACVGGGGFGGRGGDMQNGYIGNSGGTGGGGFLGNGGDIYNANACYSGTGGGGYCGNGGGTGNMNNIWSGGGGGGFFCDGSDGSSHIGGAGGGFFSDGTATKGGDGGVLIMYFKED